MFEFEGVSDALTTSVGHDHFYAPIVLKRGCNLPTGHGMVAPCLSLAWLMMDKDFGAWQHHGCGIKSKSLPLL